MAAGVGAPKLGGAPKPAEAAGVFTAPKPPPAGAAPPNPQPNVGVAASAAGVAPKAKPGEVFIPVAFIPVAGAGVAAPLPKEKEPPA